MINHFGVISSEEYEDLKNAVSWITVLIAGADGKIDTTEIEWAQKLTQIRSFSIPSELVNYYKDVGVDFHERLHSIIESVPENVQEREEILTNKLAGLNPILAKLENHIGAEMYNSLRTFAKHVAKASGGFMRFFSISHEERNLMNLPMIHPILEDES
jgi:hypothetical protein